MSKRNRIIIITSLLFSMLVGYNNCIVQKVNKGKLTSAESNQATNNDPSPTPTLPAAETPTPIPSSDVGVKNFDQINKSMSTLTGLSSTNNNIDSIYQDLKLQLPTENNIENFLASNQVGITKLAAQYCDLAVENNTIRAQIWPGFNCTAAASSSFNTAGKANFINLTLNRFWGQNIDMPLRSPASTELTSLINDLLMGENMGSSVTTRNVAKGVCITALSSLKVLML